MKLKLTVVKGDDIDLNELARAIHPLIGQTFGGEKIGAIGSVPGGVMIYMRKPKERQPQQGEE